MHGAAIVPHHDVAFRPFLDKNLLRIRRMAPKARQQIVAFIKRHADNPGTFSRSSKIKRFAPGFSMGSHQRVDDTAPLAEIAGPRLALAKAKLAGLVVDILEEYLPTVDFLSHVIRQGVVSLIGGEKIGVSAFRRHFHGSQNGARS